MVVVHTFRTLDYRTRDRAGLSNNRSIGPTEGDDTGHLLLSKPMLNWRLRTACRKVLLYILLAETQRSGHAVGVTHPRNSRDQTIGWALGQKFAL